MDEVRIRQGEISDLPQVLELIRELAEYVGYADQVANTVAQMELDGFGPNPVYGLLVAEKKNEIIGTSIYYYRYSTWKGKRLYLEDLVLRASERGKGLGKKLFEATMKKSIDEKCSGMMWQVVESNSNAIAFYEKYKAHFNRDFINCNLEMDEMKAILAR